MIRWTWRGFPERLGLDELYLADLDAIASIRRRWHCTEQLVGRDFTLWVDAGLRRAAQAEPLIDAGVGRVVAGLETLAGPQELTALCRSFGDRIVFSLDLKAGESLRLLRLAGRVPGRLGVPWRVVCGGCWCWTWRGWGKDRGRARSTCAGRRRAHPGIELSAGGGVRGVEDLDRLRQCGVAAALVASALHDGRLSREEIDVG